MLRPAVPVLCPPLPPHRPGRRRLVVLMGFVALVYLSINIMKRRGDSPSPCLSPVSILNQSVSTSPFVTLLTLVLKTLFFCDSDQLLRN